MGLQGGEGSKRSDGDGEAEAEAEGEAAESVECVAARFMQAESEILTEGTEALILMEAVRSVQITAGAAESDGAGEVVLDGLPNVNVLDEEKELDGTTDRLAHSIRTRLLP